MFYLSKSSVRRYCALALALFMYTLWFLATELISLLARSVSRSSRRDYPRYISHVCIV